jgi:transcription-repair coupling factor (superfamily II helicase)
VIYRGVSDGLAPPGIEFYLPLFFDPPTRCSTIYRPTPWSAPARHRRRVERAARRSPSAYEERRHDIERPVLSPDELYLRPRNCETRSRVHARRLRELQDRGRDPYGHNFPTAAPQEWRIDLRAEKPLAPLASFLGSSRPRVAGGGFGRTPRSAAGDAARHRTHTRPVAGWHEFVDEQRAFAMTVAPEMAGLHVVAADRRARRGAALRTARAPGAPPTPRASDPQAILRDLTTLGPGSPWSMKNMGRPLHRPAGDAGAGQDGEFVVLEYAGGDKLTCPCSSCTWCALFGRAPESAPLHKLGTDQWAQGRKRAADQIRDVAAELLDLYAQRQAKRGPALPHEGARYQAFASSFPSRRPPTRREAIRQVMQDLDSEKPMDRVVCGDVGFGKTEVAMRAAFVAAQAGKQVAVLVPTTLLAEQHTATSATASRTGRCASSPVAFRTGKESNAVLDGIEKGTVDIVVPRTGCCMPTSLQGTRPDHRRRGTPLSACATRKS